MAKIIRKGPPKKKVVGYSTTRVPGEVVKQGSPSKANLEFERGVTKKTYTPASVETGHKAYGKPGGGTDREMNSLIADAQRRKSDVTDYSSKGLHYKAGTTETKEKPAKFKTSIDVSPTVRKVAIKTKPIYEKASRPSTSKLRAMEVTKGGSDRSGNPANKTGVGKKKKVIIKKVKSFPKY